MSIKLIALDLDGTLLDSKKKFSAANRQALCACIEKGILIVPATGRAAAGIPEDIRNMPGIRYAITINGALVIDILEQHILQEVKLKIDTTLSIFNMMREYHVMYDAYVDGMGFSEARFYYNLDEYKIPKEIQSLIRATRTLYPDIGEAIRANGKPVEKINLFFDDLKIREEVRRILMERGDVVISSSMANNLEINAPGATKGTGLICLATHLGIRQEDTMAFGDGENDLSMIDVAGMGIAMGNAEPELKKKANYITGTNDEDGVARAIERFALS